MDSVEVSTVVYAPPEEVYEFLLDFPGYANYSEYLKRVHGQGDGGSGTEYYLKFAWWKLSYTAHSRVTNLDPPNRIDWEIVEDIHAHGHWLVDPVDPPEGRDVACRVTFRVDFDPSSSEDGALDLPRLVSFDWVVEKVKPKVLAEAERIVERIVVDLEGEPRSVDLELHSTPDAV